MEPGIERKLAFWHAQIWRLLGTPKRCIHGCLNSQLHVDPASTRQGCAVEGFRKCVFVRGEPRWWWRHRWAAFRWRREGRRLCGWPEHHSSSLLGGNSLTGVRGRPKERAALAAEVVHIYAHPAQTRSRSDAPGGGAHPRPLPYRRRL